MDWDIQIEAEQAKCKRSNRCNYREYFSSFRFQVDWPSVDLNGSKVYQSFVSYVTSLLKANEDHIGQICDYVTKSMTV